MTILHINSSIRGEQSHSSRLAGLLADKLKTAYPASPIIFRDLAQTPPPLLDPAALQALFTPPEQRSAAQQDRIAMDDRLIAEVQQADHIVLGVPMYNFGIPAQLKAWFDAISRTGVTFRYTANGPEGLLTGKKVHLALAFGGLHRGTPHDLVTPYLQTALGFLGMTDLTFIHAEGLAMGEDIAKAALQQAEAEVAALAV
ncbi:FMN-dependent NADH-azoreductase [Methylomonas rapida]|jgi:Acyl carrier protein phosphodiesterase|uniref:FMN dependent NADH:quinone oxidoreductase n=1 Tax=Methylomonas rapida TaxID=2963939 RepID=A0ABY7GKE1_9GAMM|nr:NAD(P)H-dependent oxidoreductase [Methylomonas rapida]WAR44969.1 NAD(P)H-dependent oxidoreductase [Methylomonas rapida]